MIALTTLIIQAGITSEIQEPMFAVLPKNLLLSDYCAKSKDYYLKIENHKAQRGYSIPKKDFNGGWR
jgi:hypothetical protein